jgi:hypothetical protein
MNLPIQSKCPYWVASEWDHKVFHENQRIRCLLGFEFSFQNCFWNLFSASGMSESYKIRNFWKLPSPFSRNKLFLEFKNIILEEKLSNWPWKFFRCKGSHSFGTFCLDVLKPWSSEIYSEVFRRRNFSWPYLNLFLNSKKTFQNMGSEYSWRIFQKQFWKLDSNPNKPRILSWKTLWSHSEATQ